MSWSTKIGVPYADLAQMIEESWVADSSVAVAIADRNPQVMLPRPPTRQSWDVLKHEFEVSYRLVDSNRRHEIESMIHAEPVTLDRTAKPGTLGSWAGVGRMPKQLTGKEAIEHRAEVLFPFRSGMDRSIRRIRMFDVWSYHQAARTASSWLELLCALNGDWDYVAALVTSVMSLVHGDLWTKRWIRIGAFGHGAAGATQKAKQVNDRCKYAMAGVERFWYVEAGTLSGYRTLPQPGYDIREEARSLAEGGVEHNYFGEDWASLCHEFLPLDPKPSQMTGFEEYVRSGAWVTAGSSSIGRVVVEYEVEGVAKRFEFKARKNSVLDVIGSDALWEYVTDPANKGRQVNIILVKSELGKVRLAVAGDLATYLKMAWVVSFIGDSYKAWPGSTAGETFPEMVKRLAKIALLTESQFGLPYDYKAYDHQPTTAELKGIVRHIASRGRTAASTDLLAEFDAVTADILDGFDNSVVILRGTTLEQAGAGGKQEDVVYTQTGGLGSGLAITSLVGNAWNSIMTGLVLKLLAASGVRVEAITRFIRGDDSSIFANNWVVLSLVDMGFKAVGAIAAPGKYGITDGMEFLRTWFDGGRAYGYINRVLPGICQRKPWSSEPWVDVGVLDGIKSAIDSARRRSYDRGRLERLQLLWSVIKTVWCRRHSMPALILSAPRSTGGFGVDVGPILYRVSPPVPKVVRIDAKVANLSSTRQIAITERGIELYGVRLDHEQSEKLAQTEALNVLVADDVPEVSTKVRERWRSELRGVRYSVTREGSPEIVFRQTPSFSLLWADNIEQFESDLRAAAPLFGRYTEVETAREDFIRYGGELSFREWLVAFFPHIEAALHEFHHSWHRSQALDYLAGKVELASSWVHPELNHLVGLATAVCIAPRDKYVSHAFAIRSSVIASELQGSRLSQRLFCW